MNTQHFETIVIGTAGFVASHLAGTVDPSTLPQILQAAVQVIIALATLLSLFRKKQPSK